VFTFSYLSLSINSHCTDEEKSRTGKCEARGLSSLSSGSVLGSNHYITVTAPEGSDPMKLLYIPIKCHVSQKIPKVAAFQKIATPNARRLLLKQR